MTRNDQDACKMQKGIYIYGRIANTEKVQLQCCLLMISYNSGYLAKREQCRATKGNKKNKIIRIIIQKSK